MPTFRNNAVDPQQIASSFDNIAKIFAPPSAQEVYAGAKAKEALQRVQQIKDLYDYAAQPGYDQGLLDRRAGIAGAYNPNQSLTAVDRNNANALRTNAADNARALQQTTMQQQGETTRALISPVGEGQTRMLPPSIASAYGLPAAPTTGVVKVNEGQNAVLPDGRTIAGTPKPLSTDQVNAETLTGLGPDARRQSAMGSIPIETIMDAATGKPRVVSRADAIGQSPAPDGRAQVQNYRAPDGSQGTARLDAGQWVDTQTGQPIPSSSVGFGINVQGNKDETGLGQTAKNNVEERLLDIANVENTVKGYKALLDRDPGAIGILGTVRGLGQDTLSVSREAAQLFGASFDGLKKDIAAGRVEPEFAKQFEHYNPNIPQAKLTELLLASQVAKMMDPNGRISNDRMKQVMDSLGGGGLLSNVDRTRSSLDGILQLATTQRSLLGGLAPAAAAVGQGGAPAGKAAPAAPAGGDATFVRGPDGKLVRAR